MGKDNAVLLRAAAGVSLIAITAAVWYATLLKERQKQKLQPHLDCTKLPAYESLIGSTPLVRLERLSDMFGRSIWVKMESMNPGATGKDRAALGMIQHAEREGQLPPPVLSSLSSLMLHQEILTENTGGKVVVDGTKNIDDDPMTQIILQAYKKSRSGGIVSPSARFKQSSLRWFFSVRLVVRNTRSPHTIGDE